MSDFDQTQTQQNLQAAFAGESMARNKYTFFAAVARKAGHTEMAETFEKFAENEKEHAKLWCNLLHGVGSPTENLRTALQGEITETEEMYPGFAETAEAEGFAETAILFRKVAEIESRHAAKFREMLNAIEGKAPAAPPKMHMPGLGKRFMLCKFCGNLEVAEPGASCPLCKNEHAF